MQMSQFEFLGLLKQLCVTLLQDNHRNQQEVAIQLVLLSRTGNTLLKISGEICGRYCTSVHILSDGH